MRRARPHLGTFVEIETAGHHHGRDQAAIAAAFAAIARVEREMSFHYPGSDLSRLNREAHRAPQAVPPWLRRVLSTASALHHRSRGAFDPSVGGRLVASGLLPRPNGAPEPDPDARFGDVRCDEHGRIGFARPLWLDLGGIAKGFAVDVAVLTLRRLGIRQGCVNAGGDLRVFGPQPQPIRLRSTEAPEATVEIGRLANGACATSAGYFSEGPADLWPVFTAEGARLSRRAGVTVLAPRCILADGLTKVVALLPEAEHEPILRAFCAQAVPA